MAATRFLLLLAILHATATITEGQISRPGFLYTRTRGRCTPQYWSRRKDAWPRMVAPRSTVWKVFGSRAVERYRKDLTLVEAATGGWENEEEEEGAFGRLVKESTAALINAYARKGYPYAAWEVKTLLIQALVSEQTASFQAQKFLEANQNCG